MSDISMAPTSAQPPALREISLPPGVFLSETIVGFKGSGWGWRSVRLIPLKHLSYSAIGHTSRPIWIVIACVLGLAAFSFHNQSNNLGAAVACAVASVVSLLVYALTSETVAVLASAGGKKRIPATMKA